MCYQRVDADSICRIDLENYQRTSRYLESSSGGSTIPFATIATLFNKYETCITSNYTNEEVDAECSAEQSDLITARDEAAEYGVSSGNSEIQSALIYAFPDTFSTDSFTCEKLLGSSTLDLLEKIFFALQVIGVIVVITFTMLDFMKAIAAGDADANKKAFTRLKTRLIVLVILLVLPTLIEFLIETFEIGVVDNSNPLCR